MDEKKEFAEIMRVMRILRAPGGCPWDAEQTHTSLRDAGLEEFYELADAIDKDDKANMCEELGDVLLHVIYHALIEEEQGGFTMADVCEGISRKMKYRHPNVFGPDGRPAGAEGMAAGATWEALKAAEKHEETVGQSLQRVAMALPANIRAAKIQKKVAGAGANFTDYEGLIKAVFDDLNELTKAHEEGVEDRFETIFGQIMFSLINISRFLGINAENSLTNAINQFINRFVSVELMAAKDGKSLSQMSTDEFYELWTGHKKT